MNRRYWVVSLVAVAGCRSSGGDGEQVTVTRVPVGITVVRRDTITQDVRLVGRLAPVPGGSVQLTAPADAVVRRVAVQVGERVNAGALLVELDSPELATRAEELRAAADVAQRDAQRQEDLFAQGITSRKQLEERQATAHVAVSAARAAETLLLRTHVTSPIRGGVQRVFVQVGERTSVGAPLAEVVDGSTLDLVAQVPTGPLALLRVGQEARVLAEGMSNTVNGRLVAIAPAVDSLTNAASVIVRIPNPGAILRAGTGATATVVIDTQRDAIIVPDSALVLVGDAMSVFLVGPDSVARAHPVRLEVRQGTRVAVTGNLKPGDHVVTTGVFGLSDGMSVTATVVSTQ